MSGSPTETVRLPQGSRPTASSAGIGSGAAAEPVLLRFPVRAAAERRSIDPEVPTAAPVWIRGYRGKRTFDLLAGGTLALLLAPLAGLVGAGVFLTGGRPVLDGEAMLGAEKHPFRRMRFRTRLPLRSEQMGVEAADLLPLFGRRNRPRTRFGAFLHATRLERLPELVAVLRGDLSLIGPPPRAELPPDTPSQPAARWELKPGMIWPDRYGADQTFVVDYTARQGVLTDLRMLVSAAWSLVSRPFRSPD